MFFYTLITELSEEDQDFVLRIYNEYGNYMYRIANDILHNHHDAEDAVNDAMIKIISHLTKFEGNTTEEIRNKIVICIRAITRNKAIDIYNDNKKRRSLEYDMLSYYDYDQADETEIEDTSINIESLIINNETVGIIQNRLLKLPEGLQDAVNLVYFCGFSGEEAADFLNISHGALRVRLYEARKRLKKFLEGVEFID